MKKKLIFLVIAVTAIMVVSSFAFAAAPDNVKLNTGKAAIGPEKSAFSLTSAGAIYMEAKTSTPADIAFADTGPASAHAKTFVKVHTSPAIYIATAEYAEHYLTFVLRETPAISVAILSS